MREKSDHNPLTSFLSLIPSLSKATRELLSTGIAVSAWALFACGYAQAQQVMDAGPKPVAVAVNPVTNEIYIANQGGPSVTYINGFDNTGGTVTDPNKTISGPSALAIDPDSNLIYVANYGGSSVSVIDGRQQAVVTSVTVGTNPCALAVDPATIPAQIYVANCGGTTVNVVSVTNNGGWSASVVATVTVGTTPYALAVNPATNMIYVANKGSGNVSVINGVNPNGPPATVTAGISPCAVAVNAVTNQAYVANCGNGSTAGNITVIDGKNNPTQLSDPKAKNPYAVGVNPVTNTIYVANNGTSNVTVINGSGNTATTTVGVGLNPVAIAVDPLNNEIYVVNTNSNNAGPQSDVSVIDGVSNSSTPIAPPGNDAINTLAVAVNPVTSNVYVTYTFGSNGYVWMFRGSKHSSTAIVTDQTAKGPYAVAVNPVTNKAYVANHDSGTVTVIDAANYSTTLNLGPLGSNPYAIAVNPATNKIYLVNNNTSGANGGGTVSVINGSQDQLTSTLSVGNTPVAIAINPVTNRIYVVNSNPSASNGSVSVIDGSQDVVVDTVAVGEVPVDIAVNPVTNQIYIANSKQVTVNSVIENNVSVIDGTNDSMSYIALQILGASHVAVDPIRNMIYVSSPVLNCFAVIDGATVGTASVKHWIVGGLVDVQTMPMAVDVTNGKVYVGADCSGVTLAIISPPDLTATNPVPGLKCVMGYASDYIAAAVNPVTNTAYLLDNNPAVMSVIDGVIGIIYASASTLSIKLGSNPRAMAVNPVTGAVYVANNGDNTVSVWSPATASVPITVAITPLAGNSTGSPTPLFDFTASNSFTSAPAHSVFYQVDTWQGPWTAATPQGSGAFTGNTATLQLGFHILYAYATDGEEATSTITGAQSSPLVGSIAAYGFLVAAPPASSCTYSLNPTSQSFASTGGSTTVNLTTAAGCPWTITGVSSWITITSPLSGTGSATIQYQVSANTGATLSGGFSVGGQTFTVTEAAPCTYSLSPNGASWPASGGTGSFYVTTGSSCPWSDAFTCSFACVTGYIGMEQGPAAVQYNVGVNSGAARSTSFTFQGQTFTIQQEGASSTGLSLAGSMAQVASAGGWNTSLTLVNLGSTAGEARLNFFANNGSSPMLPFTFPQKPALGTMAGPTFDQTLGAGATYILDTTGADSAATTTGSAQLLTSGDFGGFAIFTATASGQAAVVPLETRNASSYLLAFDNTGGVATGLAIANLTSTAASVNVVIRNDSGTQIGTGSIQLAAQGHNSFMLTDATYGFPATAGVRGTVEFDTPSGGRISVLGLRANPTATGFALTSLPLLAGVGVGGGTVAHVASGGGWQTTFTLVNTGTSAATANLNFYGDNGAAISWPLSFPQTNTTSTATGVSQSIPPGGSLVVVVADSGSATTTGSAVLTTTGNIGGFAIFRANDTGQEAVVPLQAVNAKSYILAFDNTGSLSTGLAVANVAAQAATIPLIIRNDTGAQIGSGTVTLPAHGHTSFMLTDSSAAAWTQGVRGTLEFDTPSGGQIAPLGLRAAGLSSGFTMTTIPVMQP